MQKLKKKYSPNRNSILSEIILQKTKKNNGSPFNKTEGIHNCRCALRNVKRNSQGEEKLCRQETCNLHKSRKPNREDVNESNLQLFIFLILNCSKR